MTSGALLFGMGKVRLHLHGDAANVDEYGDGDDCDHH